MALSSVNERVFFLLSDLFTALYYEVYVFVSNSTKSTLDSLTAK